MRIIISPAKKMITDADSLPCSGLPLFLAQAEILFETLKKMDFDSLKKLWKCNDAIAQLNFDRLGFADLKKNLTPAILAYDGIQYQYMAPGVFTTDEFRYIQQHLRIISGFYGILRPFDGIVPYRLEMQAKLETSRAKDLYGFWGDSLAAQLCSETDCIVNLASKEYSTAISKHLPAHVRFITCIFGEEKNGKVIEKGTACKMARGEMVRFMAENAITDPEKIKTFDRQGYRFRQDLSDSDTFVFTVQK